MRLWHRNPKVSTEAPTIVPVWFTRALVEGNQTFSPPVHVRFVRLATGDWTMEILDARHAMTQHVAATVAKHN